MKYSKNLDYERCCFSARQETAQEASEDYPTNHCKKTQSIEKSQQCRSEKTSRMQRYFQNKGRKLQDHLSKEARRGACDSYRPKERSISLDKKDFGVDILKF